MLILVVVLVLVNENMSLLF